MEHRWNLRRSIKADVVVHGVGERAFNACITDIGLGGARLSLPMRLFRNGVLDLVFAPDGEPHARPWRVQAIVIWADAGEVGVMFCHLDADTLRLLRHLLTKAAAAPLPVPVAAQMPELPARYA